MPRGIPKTSDPAPMILIEPAGDAIRLNAYGLDPGQIVDLLRRTLLHLVATHSGVQVISLDVPPAAAVVASRPAASSKPKTVQPGRNGSKPAPRGSRVLVADNPDWDPDSDQ